MIDRTCTNEKNQHTTFKKVAKNLNYKKTITIEQCTVVKYVTEID